MTRTYKAFLKGCALFLVTAILVFSFCACSQEGKATVIEKVSLNKTSATLKPGDTLQLKATASPSDAPQDFTWSSSNTTYATVTADGLVTVKNNTSDIKTVKITATSKSDSSKAATCSIGVKGIISKIGMVTSGPGENASTSAVLSWHSPSKDSILEYTTADDTGFASSTTMDVEGALSTSNWYDVVSFYRFRVVLTGLSPDTDYIFRVKDKEGKLDDSATAKFRTAGTDKTFSFLWLSDLHVPKGSTTDMNKIKALVNYANAKDGIDVDFCLFTGDMVNKGQTYKHWNYWSDSGAMNEMEYAFLPGNHDYYPHDSSERYSNCYFLDVAAHPYNNVCNGKSVTKSDYWFLWNDVLFVNIDSMAPEATKVSETVAKQKAWFEEVVKLNAGKYTYLVVSQHYAYILNKEETWGEYESWYPLFDQYKVDFALGSDSHEYARSKPLVNNQPQEGGTIYLSSAMTQGSLSVIDPILDLDSRCAFYGGGVSGGCYFTVTPEKMVMHLIGKNGNEYDSVEVSPKSR